MRVAVRPHNLARGVQHHSMLAPFCPVYGMSRTLLHAVAVCLAHMVTGMHVGAGAGAGPVTVCLRLVVVYGAYGTLPSPMTGKMPLAEVPLEPPLAMFVWLDVGMRPVFRAPHRARCSSDSFTSSAVLRARYTHGLCACARVWEQVAHVDSQ